MLIWPVDVKPLWIGMRLWVMIRCIKHGIDRLPRGDRAPADLHRLGCDPSALHDWRVIAQHFLDGATDQVRFSEQFAEFTGMLQQRQYGVADKIGRRHVACKEQTMANVYDLRFVELLAVLFGVDQAADQIGPAFLTTLLDHLGEVAGESGVAGCQDGLLLWRALRVEHL